MRASDLIERSFKTAEEHGWHDKPRSARVIATLFHSEVSEFAEEARAGKDAFYESNDGALVRLPDGKIALAGLAFVPDGSYIIPKPSGQAIELVDLAIRIGDYAGVNGWPLKFGQFEISEKLTERWVTVAENIRTIDAKTMFVENPLEFASFLHEDIAKFSESMTGSINIRQAQEILSRLLGSIIVYFFYRNWNFDVMFAIKNSFNKIRPYRHGGKLA